VKNISIEQNYIKKIKETILTQYKIDDVTIIDDKWVKSEMPKDESYKLKESMIEKKYNLFMESLNLFDEIKIIDRQININFKGDNVYTITVIAPIYKRRFEFKCFCSKSILYEVIKEWDFSKLDFRTKFEPYYSSSIFCDGCRGKFNDEFKQANPSQKIHLNLYLPFRDIRIQRVNVIRKIMGIDLPKSGVSEGERQLRDVIKELFPSKDILYNDYTGIGMELDIYLPEIKLGFEYQGQQHYKYVPHFHKNKKNFIHRKALDNKKKTLCLKNEIKLIEIFDHESLNKQFIINKLKEIDILP
ncbi:MAG TPA: hypothetical protein VJB12_02160, partial [Candidatus Nanoarchaeia archaeon]|nr:hypothetical protein [Candidatus Nanoarchaeia archaeon]